MWLIGAVVCLLAANRGSSCSMTRAMDGRIVRCGNVSSCQSVATSEIVKALMAMSPSHVRSATAATRFYFLALTYTIKLEVALRCYAIPIG